MENITVLQIGKYYPPHSGGMESHVEALVSGLQTDAELRVVVCGDRRRETLEVRDGVAVSRAGRWFEVASTAFCPGMIPLVAKDTSSVVHLHLPNPMGCLAYLASGHAGKLVVTYHSDVVRQRRLARLFEPLLNEILARSAAIIVSTKEYLASSVALAPYRDKAHIIPFGINLEEFANPDWAAVHGIRSQYGDQLVLAVGRLVYYKGFEYLIRAMQFTPGRLVLIGDGPLRKSLTALASSLGLDQRISFLGNLPDREKLPYFRAAKVFAFPSIARSEAFGIAQIEAMAAGTPVVNTRLDSGVPAVSLDGVTGLTVAPKDPAALAAAISTLLTDSALHERLARAARVRAEKEFSQTVMVARTRRVYTEVLRETFVPEPAFIAAAR